MGTARLVIIYKHLGWELKVLYLGELEAVGCCVIIYVELAVSSFFLAKSQSFTFCSLYNVVYVCLALIGDIKFQKLINIPEVSSCPEGALTDVICVKELFPLWHVVSEVQSTASLTWLPVFPRKYAQFYVKNFKTILAIWNKFKSLYCPFSFGSS